MAGKSFINFTHKGNFNHLENFLAKTIHIKPVVRRILEKYGRRGVDALREATPKDSGKTANSWTYEVVEESNGNLKIVWRNTNIANDWAPVAILLQYGHATKNGGYVQGIDYINPALQPVFEALADEAWREVTKG